MTTKLYKNAADALEVLESGQRVFIHGASSTPLRLIEGLVGHADRLRNVEIMHLHTFGDACYADQRYAESFRVANLFVGGNMRPYYDGDRVDYLPCFLSEIPALFRSGQRPIDVALMHLSPPDKHGFCTLGCSVDVALEALLTAKTVIAQINPRMPRVHGDGFVHISRVDHYIEVDEPIPEVAPAILGDVELAIGRNAAGLIEDGATLQMGIGGIPDAVLKALHGHRHLGVHTEMWSDGLLDLIEAGAVDNSRKKTHRGKTVSGFIMGTQRVYDFIDDDPSVIQARIDWVNSPHEIAKNPKVTAINSAIEVDLTGQVCADSIGHRIISGVGGQMDFIRGASLSQGGKPIIALPSRTRKGRSRLVSALNSGAGVVTTRSHVHYIVTEYGVANLFGRTLNERAEALIAIAHPDDREQLSREWREIRAS
ncbi:acetyl-CoA hydrolase/transferase family protein [Sedimenticola selenatireducens]|uniref:acetyl-CoA hydrolase/transferase family protein n=1 Tax=Sedimenticola selenatireducens TaxID=191960 RepID=UPI0021B1B53B|nr:acetyl-CoA hydrolase/transferase C-terminal domain-containing protein [Sedimenticola selenatireducens]